ncbi:MAG: arylsulfatase [Planctomycetota bacterium]|jgi:arylsulfatase A-like enzyme
MYGKHHFISGLMLWIVLAMPSFLQAGEPKAPEPPNFLIILCDDLGYSDLGCYGSEINTPQLDAIANSGRRFAQFYNTARCWPTRGALLTGYYAQQIRRDTVPGVKSGGQGTRPKWAKLLPERISKLGYHSYHSGKWHVDGLPTQNGFEKSYSLQDHDRHFHPKNHTLDDKPLPPATSSDGYYSSNEIASRAIDQLRYHQENHQGKPFFSYVAFTAPHFPLHAPQEIVDKYKPIYQQGWDRIRQQRWNKLKQLGLARDLQRPSDIETDIGPPYHFPEALQKLGTGELNRPLPWEQLSPQQKAFQADKMAVHAAMIEAMDSQIGRIFDFIKQDPARWENTLVLFLSDNGASAEIMVRGDGHNPNAAAGSAQSYLCLGPGWSSVSNTPFRRHKTWVHEGGIATPMIAHWPAGIQSDPNPVSTPYHVIDIAPTILALASKHAGTEFESPDPKFPGLSFAKEFQEQANRASRSESRVLWWQHEANRALRDGNLKIVASEKDSPWELYDLAQDRAETKNLATQRPQELERLAKTWNELTEQFRLQATAED